mgnify:CR=1 FL=1
MYDELDILREVGSIAAGHGSIVLSTMLSRNITLNVPSVDIIACDEVPKNISLKNIDVAIFSQLFEGFEGAVAFVLDQKSVFRMVDLYCKVEDGESPSRVTETALSLIREIGNVIIGAYLDVLSSVVRKAIVPPYATIISGDIDNIMYLIFSPYERDDYACFIETIFEEPKDKIKGGFYLILSSDSADELRRRLKEALDKKRNV